jgi:hypothetical protein
MVMKVIDRIISMGMLLSTARYGMEISLPFTFPSIGETLDGP